MNILAIDTCTEVCSVCLYQDGQWYSRFVKDIAKASSLILPLCDEVFSKAGIQAQNLDLITYTKGPGSFTGVRMCVGITQGIASAYDVPTMGFSTLEVVGFGASQKYGVDNIAVALDARMGEVYWGLYQDQTLLVEALKKPDEVDSLSDDFIGVGIGFKAYGKTLVSASGVTQYHADFYPMAENLVFLSLTKVKENLAVYDKLALPLYLRNNVAVKSLK